MRRFDGLTVLISGATGGFGAVAARRFAAEGARLVLTDLHQEKLDKLAAEIGGDVVVRAGDVGEPKLHRDLVELAVAKFGALDVAVNNAGVANPQRRLEDTPDDEVRWIIEIDLLAVFWAMKAQIPAMDTRKGGRGGAIVNIASLAGIAGAPTLSAYVAAKHGVVGLTRTAAAENARRGIRVNAICPAYARTPMVEQGLLAGSEGREAEAEAQLVRGVPMRRLGTPEEVVEAILFAASPQNGFMTGQALAVDGGITAV